jgi:hypothetical protein
MINLPPSGLSDRLRMRMGWRGMQRCNKRCNIRIAAINAVLHPLNYKSFPIIWMEYSKALNHSRLLENLNRSLENFNVFWRRSITITVVFWIVTGIVVFNQIEFGRVEILSKSFSDQEESGACLLLSLGYNMRLL